MNDVMEGRKGISKRKWLTLLNTAKRSCKMRIANFPLGLESWRTL